MPDLNTPCNRRILIIDDNEAIHADFRKILAGTLNSNAALRDAHAALFGEESKGPDELVFELESAFQGRQDWKW